MRVHPSEFTREFRAPSPPAVPPSGDQGANVMRNLRAFVLRALDEFDPMVNLDFASPRTFSRALALGSALPKFLHRMTGDLARFPAFVGISYADRDMTWRYR